METVADLMTRNPLTATPDTSLFDVLEIMRTTEVRQLPIVLDNRLVGIVTDRDLRLAMTSPLVLHERKYDEKMLHETPVESCMTPDPISVTPDTPAYKAAETLSAYKFGALPVVEGEILVGIVSVTDFLRHYARAHTPR